MVNDYTGHYNMVFFKNTIFSTKKFGFGLRGENPPVISWVDEGNMAEVSM